MSRHYVVSAWICGSRPSGAARRLRGIIGRLPDELEPDERVTVLHGPDTPPPATTGQDQRVTWRRIEIPAGPTWRRALAERRFLPPELDRLDATLVDLGALPIPRKLPCPAVLTIHDVRDAEGPPLSRRGRPAWLARAVLRASLGRAARVLVPSEFTARRIARFAPDAPTIDVIPNGVETPTGPQATEASSSRRFFLHVGHLESRKNPRILIDAFARFLSIRGRQKPDMRLVFVGADHGLRKTLVQRARRFAIADRTIFRGVVSDAELVALYASARAVLVPSHYEGFGLAALEALAAGTPTIVSDAGALPEVVNGQAAILPIDDVDAWADAMLAAADTEDLPSLRGARRAHAAQFSFRSAALGTLDSWRSVAVSRHAATNG